MLRSGWLQQAMSWYACPKDAASHRPLEADLSNFPPMLLQVGDQEILLQDTLRLAAHAHALVVPSVCEEACASTVLEGLALGKTVFALKLGGTPELADYALGPDQLRLHDTMASLVDALLAFRQRPDYQGKPARNADPAQAAGQLLALYRMPAGAVGLQ